MSDEMVEDLVDDTVDASNELPNPPALDDPFLVRFTSQAPWWLVSIVFHILLIVLAYMFSIVINIGEKDEDMVTVTPGTPNFRENIKDETKPKPATSSALLSKSDIAPTDKDATVLNKIEVPPDILKMAELGDHIETINFNLVDNHAALGNPDATSMTSLRGDPSDAGGNNMRSTNNLEEMITAGTDKNRPSADGWSAGHGKGKGNNEGNGLGSFGDNRSIGGRKLMLKRGCITHATENAVEAALRWLSLHQEYDGHWDAKKFGAAEKTDTAVTGFALLAFLGCGHSEKLGSYKDNVQRGIAWLKSKQAASGLIFDTTDAGGHRGEGYPGAIATMAIAEAAAMANNADTREAAQRAVTYCCDKHQAGEGSDKLGWRYHPKMEGDTSVTGWFMMALKSAKIARLNVNHAAFDGAIKFLDSVEHKAPGGDPGYAPASTYWYTVKDVHEPHRLTAIGCLCRQYLGWKKDDLQASVDGFVAKGGVPSWGGNGGGVDLYYWYYGSLCTFQQGGEVWKKWNEGLKSALVPNQRKDGDDAGSWDPVGAYATEWGRVGETALGCLCLEVYYRYGLLNPNEAR